MVPAFLWAYLLASFAVLCAHAAPTPLLLARQQNAPFNGPQTVQTRNVTNVAGGSIVQDCTNTFTPIVVNNENLVQETSVCTEIFVPTGQSPPPPPSQNTTLPPTSTTTISTTDSSTDTTTTTNTDTSTTTDPIQPPASTDSSSSTTTDTGTDSSSTDTTAPPATTDTSTSTDTSPAPPADTNSASSDPAAAQSSGATTDPVLGPTSVAQGTAQGDNSPTTSGAASATSGVTIPGKELQVLPIGLGVFAGISVIALIVVGLVTYERTKYRKAFRQRRLAASGAEMGYGGMSERR